jgi:hypothetical protein
MSAADERLAELLRRVLDEGLDPASKEALDMVENEDVAGSIARSQAVIGLLDRSALEQRADLAGARDVEPQHAAAVRRFVAERSAPRRTRGTLWFAGVGLAAAAALVLWLAPWRAADAPSGPEVHLGGGTGQVRVDAGGIAWDLAPSSGGWFVVVVRDAAGNEVARSPALFESAWPLAAGQRADWPAEATFEVEVRDGTGRLEATLR